VAVRAGSETGRPVAYASKGLRLEAEIHATTAAVMQRLDGKAPLAEILQAMAQESGSAMNDAPSPLLPDLKRLLQLGMLGSNGIS
jgi:hypothetical protein